MLEMRDLQGAGKNLIREMELNDAFKYHNFFRMRPNGFEKLLRLVSPLIIRSDLGREPISIEITLAITLRFLASGHSMSTISYLCRVGLSTVSQIITETTDALWIVLQPLYVPSPSEEQWKNDAELFEKLWSFRNCVGAIDGKHVDIVAPPNSGSDYYNY